jgi:transposase
MARPALRLKLSKPHRSELSQLLKSGVRQVRVVLRALALVHLADGASAPQVAKSTRLSAQTVRNLIRRYKQHGLEGALYERERPGAAPILDNQQKQRIMAMVCSDPPTGFARWTVRLIAEEAVKRRLVPRVGREAVRILLVHHDLRPWREKNVVRTRT